MTRLTRLACPCLLAGGLAGASLGAVGQPRLEDVLARLSTYLLAYEADLATLVAEETYVQWTEAAPGAEGQRRTITSDFGFLRLPGRPEWLGLRDTFLVDGESVRRPGAPLDRLLADGSSGALEQARRIVEENARYNLGDVARTINVPMLALDLLNPRHHWRLSFRRAGEAQVDGRLSWKVAFTERERPTLVRTPQGRNRPARGLVWVDPDDGAVLRTDLTLEDSDAGDRLRATVTVSYRREASLDLLVPSEMRERYYTVHRRAPAVVIEAVATYANFRQFNVTARIVR